MIILDAPDARLFRWPQPVHTYFSQSVQSIIFFYMFERALGSKVLTSCCVVAGILQAAKAATAAAAPPKTAKEDGPALEDDSNEITDPTAYFENRVKFINAKKAKGVNPYPHKFHVSMSLPDYIERFGGMEPGQHDTETTVSVAGEQP